MSKKEQCRKCGGSVVSRRENYKYDASGLDNIILVGIEIRHCASCGERQALIPRLDDLHRSIAQELAGKKERLAPREIRFLRKYLGLSSADFA